MGFFDIFKHNTEETDTGAADGISEVIGEGKELENNSEENIKEYSEADSANVEDIGEDVRKTSEEIGEKTKESIEDSISEVQEKPYTEGERIGFFGRLKSGLNKTRQSIMDGVDTVLGAFTEIDEDLFEELEEVLIMADIGVPTTTEIMVRLKKTVKRKGITNPMEVREALISEISALLSEGDIEEGELPTPTVLLIIGVNGVGKTTTIGKLAGNFKRNNKDVILAAADTFRAAAIEQLEVWGLRNGIEVIKKAEKSDPASVIFDAVNTFKSRKGDILICDTAGRLHNKKNLMEELKKIGRVIEREYPEANKEVYLVLDATTGQNALSQAKLFSEVSDITGIILTKLDGTAKGGLVIAIKHELNIPVKYIGVGEGTEDLQVFDSEGFARALFGDS